MEKEVSALGVFDVEGDASLIGVEGPPVEAFLGVRSVLVEGALEPARVSARLLDLENVATEVGEGLTTKEAVLTGEVQDSERTKKVQAGSLPRSDYGRASG